MGCGKVHRAFLPATPVMVLFDEDNMFSKVYPPGCFYTVISGKSQDLEKEKDWSATSLFKKEELFPIFTWHQ